MSTQRSPRLRRLPWPMLSKDLIHMRDPGVCQSCGARADLGAELKRWREHDDQDRPTLTIVVLCDRCERIVAPHPRLYDPLDQHAPDPGSMPVCVDCRHRDGLRCLHPDATANGGPGVDLRYPTPHGAHILFGGRGQRRGDVVTLYLGPVECMGREEA